MELAGQPASLKLSEVPGQWEILTQNSEGACGSQLSLIVNFTQTRTTWEKNLD